MIGCEWVTLPKLSVREGVSLDRLRHACRTHPELKKLGTVVGAARAFSPAECERIIAVLQARGAGRGGNRKRPEVASANC